MDDNKGGFGVKTVFEAALRKSGVLIDTKGEEDNMGKNNNQGYNSGTSRSADKQDKDRRREELIERILSEDEKEKKEEILKKYFSGEDDFFEDGGERVNTKYLDIYVRVLAYTFIKEDDKLSQLRNFYNEVERVERALTLDDKYDFKKCIYNLGNMAAYKYSSGDVGEQFCHFMEHSRKIIHSKDDFNVFKMHFEGILCYFPREKGDK